MNRALGDVKFDDELLWVDSTMSLAWIKSKDKELKTFSENYFPKIQQLTNTENWRYVNTKTNPANIISRGIIHRFIVNKGEDILWWYGPSFSKDEKLTWTVQKSKQTNYSKLKMNFLLRILAVLKKQTRWLTLPMQFKYKALKNRKNPNLF